MAREIAPWSKSSRGAATGNPPLWPTCKLKYKTDDGVEATLELPLTIADWAATEGRFKQDFREAPIEQWNDDMAPFHEFLELTPADRGGKVPFIYTLNGKRLRRQLVSAEMVTLAEERCLFWSQLRQLAGKEPRLEGKYAPTSLARH